MRGLSLGEETDQSNRQRVASGNSYCCALITRHPVGAESMADSVSEVS